MKVFFDTSAFVKRFVEEVGSEEADSTCESASELGLSVICFPEIISALNRKVRNDIITQEIYRGIKNDVLDDIRDVEIINLTPRVLEKATILLETNFLRSLDAMHIACAVEWGADLFVSSDERQVVAAESAGLTVKFIEGFKPKK